MLMHAISDQITARGAVHITPTFSSSWTESVRNSGAVMLLASISKEFILFPVLQIFSREKY